MSEEKTESTDELMKEIAALKAKNEQLIGINKNIAKKMDAMEEGKKHMLEKMQGDEERKLIESGDFDALVNMRSQQALNAKDEALRELERKYDDAARNMEILQVGSLARDAAIASGVRPEAQEEMMLMVGQRFKMKDGQLSGFDISGNELLNDKGEQMGMGEYIASLAPSKSYLFNDANGSGSNGNTGNMSGVKKSDMSREQKSDFVEKHGSAKFLALPS